MSLRRKSCLAAWIVWSLLLIGILWGHRAAAQSAATESAAPSASAIAKVGRVETGSSRVYVFVDKTGLGHQHGVEAKLLASNLILGAHHNAGTLVFDMTSFDADTDTARRYVGLGGTTDASTRKAVNENMKGAYVLDVRRYPTATYQVDSAKPTGQTSNRGLPTYRLDGQFTLHGTTRPLSILVETELVKGWLHVRGGFTIKQTDFGITPYSKAFGAIGVANDLKVYGDIYAAPNENVATSEIPEKQ